MINLTLFYITLYIHFNGKNSAECTLQCGVPQGSILGPLFFIIFVNDMFNISNVLSNVLYADDTCIYLRGSDITALFDLLNVELNSLYEWLNANKLTLNVDFFLGKKIFIVSKQKNRQKIQKIDIYNIHKLYTKKKIINTQHKT